MPGSAAPCPGASSVPGEILALGGTDCQTVTPDGVIGQDRTGLALIMGVLSSMLSGAAYGTELGDMDAGPRAGRDGHFLLALNVAAFEEVARFKERVDAAIRQIHASRRAPGVERLYAPGEKELLCRREYERDGIPLNGVTLGDLRRTAEGLGVAVGDHPWLATGHEG